MTVTRDFKAERRKQARRDEAAGDALAGRRSPPHDANAERGVLAAIAWSPIARGLAFEQLNEADFYLPQHQHIFHSEQLLHDESREIDALVIKDKLKTLGTLDEAGGDAYIDEVLTTETSGLHIGEYIEILVNQAIARGLHYKAQEILADVHAGGQDAHDCAEKAVSDIASLADRRRVETDNLADLDAIFAEQMAEGTGKSRVVVRTGYPEFDNLFDPGILGGELAVISGRPGEGKTTLAENIALNACRAGSRIAYFSCEERSDELTGHFLAMLAATQHSIIRRRDWGSEQAQSAMPALLNARDQLAEWFKSGQLALIQAPGISPRQLRSRIERLKRNGLDAVFVDYLQLMQPDISRRERHLEVGSISAALKRHALETDCAIVAMSQLNREKEGRTSPEPILSDLRESGSIEQDANAVLMIYTEMTQPGTQLEKLHWKVRLAKNRNGRTTRGKSNPEFNFVGWNRRIESKDGNPNWRPDRVQPLGRVVGGEH